MIGVFFLRKNSTSSDVATKTVAELLPIEIVFQFPPTKNTGYSGRSLLVPSSAKFLPSEYPFLPQRNRTKQWYYRGDKKFQCQNSSTEGGRRVTRTRVSISMEISLCLENLLHGGRRVEVQKLPGRRSFRMRFTCVRQASRIQ